MRKENVMWEKDVRKGSHVTQKSVIVHLLLTMMMKMRRWYDSQWDSCVGRQHDCDLRVRGALL